MTPTYQPMLYFIRVQGHLDQRWLRWFEHLNVDQLPEGETVISGMMDQSSLHGVLDRLLDLGLEIISLQRQFEPDSSTQSGVSDEI